MSIFLSEKCPDHCISPIDYIQSRLQSEGFRVGEVTGRKDILNYQEKGGMTYQVRSASELKTNAKIETVRKFNSGEIDVVILNKSGATGISLRFPLVRSTIFNHGFNLKGFGSVK